MLASYDINRVQYPDLISFFNDLNCDKFQIRLLHFLARHRCTKLSFDTIRHAIGIAKAILKREINALIKKGIMLQQHTNGLITYCLADTYPVQEYFDKLAMLDWSETSSLIKQCHSL